MTLASTVSVTACALEAGVGLLALSLAGAPGWRHLRVLALAAFTAALYSASNVPQTLTEAAAVIVPASQLSLFSIAVHLAAWVVYTAPDEGDRKRLGWIDRSLLAGLLGAAALAVVPGALAAPRVLVHEVPWLGLRYATAAPTALAQVVFLGYFAAMAVPAWRFVSQVRRGARWAQAHLATFVLLIAAGVNEGLVAAHVVDGPYLLDLGFLAVVLPLAGEVSRRLAAWASALAERSTRLEADAAEAARALEEARRALRESERNYAEIFDATREAIVVHDPGTGRAVEVNQALAELVGASREELLDHGTSPFDGDPPYSAAEAAALMRRAQVEGPQHFEWLGRRKDGARVWVEVTLVSTTLRGAPRLVASMRDVTARKQAEAERERLQQQLLQAQKLESIGRLAGGVAHDFNNLLTVILCCSQVIREELDRGAAASPEDVAEIHAAAERARDVTRQLLAFARRQVIAPVTLDPARVVQGSERLLKRVLGEDIEQRFDLQPGVWNVHCDPGQLEQVILNLALNARDAMPRGGTLAIELRNLPAGREGPAARPPGDCVQLVVRDTGEGIPPEAQAHLFEPFYTTKPQGAGTGLGLATVHGIVTQSGGQISVESAPGRGTSFLIHLPRAPGPVQPARPPGEARARRGTETLLLVEDERSVRGVATRALSEAGYRVLTARDGAEALALAAAEAGPIDLLVTDVVMPGLDGRQLAEALRASRGTLRVLFLSGYTDDVISHRGVLDPGVHFQEKPFTPEVLRARVRAVLDGDPS